jgi:hypothetical protein
MKWIQLADILHNIPFFVLTISFLMIGFLYAFYYKYSKELILSVFGQRFANQYLRDDNVFKRRVNNIFSILMVLNISFFIWTINVRIESSLFNLVSVFIFVIIYYFLKYIIIMFLGILIKMKQISTVALFFTTLFDKVFALFSFPLLLIYYFYFQDLQEYSILIISGLLILFFILKIFWMLKIGIKSFGLSSFYLFLYICILEFFPLTLLCRGILFE